VLASPPDLLRLVAVPVFAWAAYRDINTRRVPNRTWAPLVAVGVVALAWDGLLTLDADAFAQRLLVIRALVSLGIVAPLGYGLWRIGGFGGADAKAVMVLAVLFPTFPTFYLPGVALPVVRTPLGVFSMTVLTNTVLLGLAYPLVLAGVNLLRGRVGLPMFVARPVGTRVVTEEYGRLLETRDGFTRRGLDLDALRMYLRWRGTSLAAVRARPERYRDPASLPAERNDPGDGALTDGGGAGDGTAEATTAGDDRPTDESTGVGREEGADGQDRGDEWGAATFLAEIEGSASGTTPDQLREGLEVLVAEEEVWVSPGIPFIVPMFVALLAGLTYGDLLFGALGTVGLVP
jgi:preflagellin peptidase FlaK